MRCYGLRGSPASNIFQGFAEDLSTGYEKHLMSKGMRDFRAMVGESAIDYCQASTPKTSQRAWNELITTERGALSARKSLRRTCKLGK